MAQSVAGSVKFLGESGFAKVLSVAGASQAGTYGMMKDENGEVYDIGKDWSKWGDQILQGVDEYRKQNPDQTVQIIDKQGFFNTAAQYIDRPENILQISLESVPALVSAAVGHYTGLNAAKAIGWGPKVLPYIGRVVGFASQTFGSTYAEARQQGTPPELAFPQAFLTAAGEGMLEDITLPGKLKLFHGTGKLAQKGIAGTAAQLLMGYPDGAVEEGTQRLNANFWNMVFSDHNQNLIDGVLEEAAAGGFAEVGMRAGFGGAGKVYKMTFKEAFENGRAMQEFVSTARLDPVARQEITDEIAKATIEKATGVQVENISELGLTSEEILSLEPEEAQAVVETLQTATETPPTSTPDGQTQAQPIPTTPQVPNAPQAAVETLTGKTMLFADIERMQTPIPKKQKGKINLEFVGKKPPKDLIDIAQQKANETGETVYVDSSDGQWKISDTFGKNTQRVVRPIHAPERPIVDQEAKKITRQINKQKKSLEEHPYYKQVLSDLETLFLNLQLPNKIDFGQNTTEAMEATEGKPELRKMVALEGQPGLPFDLIYEDFTNRNEADEPIYKDVDWSSDPHAFFDFIEPFIAGNKKSDRLNKYALEKAMQDPSFYLELVKYNMLKAGESSQTITEAIDQLQREMNDYATGQDISEDIPESLEDDPETRAEREAIQSEGETEYVGGFLDGLAESSSRPPETPGPAVPSPAAGQGGGKHKGFVDLTTLQEASEEVKGDVRRIADVFSHVSKNLLEKISFALENIHPGLSSAVRWHAFDKMKNTYNSLVQAKPFVKSMKRLRRSNRKAYDRLGYLLKKNDYNAMMELAGKYNLDATITDVLELLKDIYTRAEYAGVRIEFRNDYFPRKVKDMKKFLEIVYAIPGLDRSIIEDALKKKADKQGRKVEDLTDREISDTINTLFRGFKTGGVVMAAPGGSKERLVSEFTEAVDEAYSSAEDGLVIYIEEMESAIAEYEFFGRMSTDLRRLRSRESYYRSRLSALTKLLANAKTEAEKGKLSDQYKDLTDAVTKLEGKLFDAQKTLDDIMQSQSEFNEMDRRPSIGEITAELVRKDEIKPGQEREVQQILKAYFNPGVQNVLIRSAMEVGYLAALGNSVLHNITQLGEVANALLEDPILAFPAAAKVLLREEIVKHEDIPHKLFSEEINLGGGFNRMVNRILRITLGADDFGKAVHRNTAAMKAFRKAANEDSAFIEELKLYFGDQWQTALNDMKTGQVTENLLFYVFNRVSDRQPITAAEMPVYYHTSPNIARPFFYMLKSFQLNRMNSIYQNARRDIRNGHYAKGLMGAAIATAVYLAFDTSMKLLKDAIRGRKIDDDEVEDAVIDNSLRMLFMSKYMIESFDYRSPSEVIMNSIKHPFMSVIDDAVRAYKNEDTEPLEKYIPIVGREIYESGK
jgi:hypothetical protein